MCKELEEMRAEAKAEGIEQNKLDIAKKMLSAGKLSISEIVDYSGLPVKTITELAKA